MHKTAYSIIFIQSPQEKWGVQIYTHARAYARVTRYKRKEIACGEGRIA